MKRKVSIFNLILAFILSLSLFSCIDRSLFPTETNTVTNIDNEEKQLELNATSLFLEENSGFQLNILNADDIEVEEGLEIYYKWSTTNEYIAMVVDGYVVGTGTGNATITVRDSENRVGRCEVAVGEMSADRSTELSTDIGTNTSSIRTEVESLTLNYEDIVLKVGQTIKLRAAITPIEARNNEVSYRSSNAAIVDVYTDGTVYARRTGEVTIVAKAGFQSAYCTVIVPSEETKLEKFNLSEDKLEIRTNNSKAIKYNWEPLNIKNVTVDYRIKDNEGKDITNINKAKETQFVIIDFIPLQKTITFTPISTESFVVEFSCLNLTATCSVLMESPRISASLVSAQNMRETSLFYSFEAGYELSNFSSFKRYRHMRFDVKFEGYYRDPTKNPQDLGYMPSESAIERYCFKWATLYGNSFVIDVTESGEQIFDKFCKFVNSPLTSKGGFMVHTPPLGSYINKKEDKNYYHGFQVSGDMSGKALFTKALLTIRASYVDSFTLETISNVGTTGVFNYKRLGTDEYDTPGPVGNGW